MKMTNEHQESGIRGIISSLTDSDNGPASDIPHHVDSVQKETKHGETARIKVTLRKVVGANTKQGESNITLKYRVEQDAVELYGYEINDHSPRSNSPFWGVELWDAIKHAGELVARQELNDD